MLFHFALSLLQFFSTTAFLFLFLFPLRLVLLYCDVLLLIAYFWLIFCHCRRIYFCCTEPFLHLLMDRTECHFCLQHVYPDILAACVVEHLCYPLPSLCAHLEILLTVFTQLFFDLLHGNFPGLSQICLVGQKHDYVLVVSVM